MPHFPSNLAAFARAAEAHEDDHPCVPAEGQAEGRRDDGYELWLRYRTIANAAAREACRSALSEVFVAAATDSSNPNDDSTFTTTAAIRSELQRALRGLLARDVHFANELTGRSQLVVAAAGGLGAGAGLLSSLKLESALRRVGNEGFVLRHVVHANAALTVVAANTPLGALYGVFAFLRGLVARRASPSLSAWLSTLDVVGVPRMSLRLLNHWDNLDGSVERGYAGASLWDWHKLPRYRSPRYRDYARANASIGINGVVLNNVNANARILTAEFLPKVAALADEFRPYGLRVYVTARFSAPIELGGLKTADPLDENVRAFWRDLCRQIYAGIPDFGGFLVKANSEGQPGPGDYGRTHADGANLLGDALAAAGSGIVMWRAFVYSAGAPDDRAKQAYEQLAPLDGKFRDNVVVQVKNGPIDFQPREPFHPLFGAMPRTALAAEFQITQEYLGGATHLVYLAPLFKETLDADTYARGAGSTVGRLLSAGLSGVSVPRTGIVGVSNIGSDRNWCGHPFGQANWYAFGRLAWDHTLGAEAIADEWLRQTFVDDDAFVKPMIAQMIASREAVVNYMTPLGLHHIMAADHHFGPGPWVDDTGRVDWTSPYYHRADAHGLGFDRSARGSNAVAQYHAPWPRLFGTLSSCPENLLLWFHHVPWDHRLKSGRTLWNELCARYQAGVDFVRRARVAWASLSTYVDDDRFAHVRDLLAIQEDEACWWRDACVLYFQTFARRPLPPGWEPTKHTLEEYRRFRAHDVPGTPRPQH